MRRHLTLALGTLLLAGITRAGPYARLATPSAGPSASR
jgi:hypothetical protein